ncbi:tubulin-dependent ATPase kip3 [Ophidiomyces ophidiicola]|uniref:Tubulin-dependent ATPase kip3 n=1 Tax=Ophidiomyces ophidiicola TaxID=1387563 RepID=A0ACB8UU00_9EURO|nr:tubulin-dependent ATPase kip3 [Ophidiomyces ophidiicola]KAI1907664.1 tubulin-dependent ATPase kip3 [Ophidiomyces ophidiicola]KAI1910889.1 tubulin-dependent ATPase kip3 [Ophidiomyces ophidiicola]KAI1925301.1 tubulin-dependent ATPase kip3 [Ophidiomyces ophidiicola]KAI1937445.1 tubulin-dependent ATPase kip3 [Ophidiomyces ophidiicola]KAI1951822.1 tubulin-dependent ATPase kip3 [Ophidiomyces ophidiicola]
MAAAGGASSISVTVRVRPFTIREAAQLTKCEDGPLFLGDGSLAGVSTPKLQQKGIRSVIKVVDNKCLVFDPPEDNPVHRFSRSVVPNGKRVKDQTFMFDRVFDENTTQGEVYEASTRNLLDSVLDGYNATVFAYGATGCGKTHTITGTAQQPGIIFLTMQELFERISERSHEKVTEVSLSYLEIYNETIRDLLVSGGNKAGLMLREDAKQSVSVAGLSSHHPQNVQEVMDMIMRGNECRTMSPTDANATSSRSHAVLQINLAQKDRNADINEPHTMATLSIIDLAGSERASATKNRGERLIEGANINKSLLALGSCINALCDPRKRNHVPYRNSKLTRLLKFSLGGNCKTVMIVCVSPSSQHFDETQNTLRYANRAKNIQTKVTRNVYNVNRHVKDFLVKIDEQMALINELKQQQKDYETVAFAKFKKQTEKREAIAREGISRLRSAYEHAASERQESVNNMLRLKHVGRRIAILSSWIAAFDGVCANRDGKSGLGNLQAVRKTAQGILLELEGSRQHYHQRIAKCNWDRALNSALENSIRQLKEIESGDTMEVGNLKREVELLRFQAERDVLNAVSEQEKAGEMETVQMLLQANFETIAAIEEITHLSEDEAIEIGKGILGKLLQTCTTTTSHVVKPDGSPIRLAPIPTPRIGSPKKRKKFSIGGTVVLPRPARLSLIPTTQSPNKGSPRRRKLGAPKKVVAFTPVKTEKSSKRSVRWKDDVEDGALAEFEKTPQRPQESPEAPSSCEPTLPPAPTITSALPVPTAAGSRESSPIPAPPELNAIHVKNNSRFKAGFLSKRTNGSPVPASLPRLPSSDSENSPLRSIEASSFLNRQSLDRTSINSQSPENGEWKPDKLEAMRINSAMRRISGNHAATLPRVRRRSRSRSPPVISPSPTHNENTMFTASQARRMVKSEKDQDLRLNVLSPRTLPVTKNPGQRRVTSVDLKPRESMRFSGTAIPAGGSLRGSPRGTANGIYR